MLGDERLVQNDARAAWVRWMVIVGSALAILTLVWAARLLNRAWSRSYATEAEQRALALRLRTTIDSLSQGVAVFGPDRRLKNWNECFQVLLDLPKVMLRSCTTYGTFVEHTSAVTHSLRSIISALVFCFYINFSRSG